MTTLKLETNVGEYVFNHAESPIAFRGLDEVIVYADKTGYRHVIFNGALYSKVHRDLNDSFKGRNIQPPDTWVKVGLNIV